MAARRALWRGEDWPANLAAWDAGGDLDADGAPDLIVALGELAYEAKLSGLVIAISGATGEVLHVSHEYGPLDRYGSSVAMLDDVDGDGRDDYAVGAPQARRPDEEEHLGSRDPGASPRYWRNEARVPAT